MRGATAVTEQDAVFAGNRAVGRVTLGVALRDGRTHRADVAEAGSLRVRFPNRSGEELEAVLVNTAGGIAGGDRFDVAITAGAGTDLLVTTTSAEKVYRTHGPDAAISVRLDVGSGASVAWLPQETILFDRVGLARTIDVTLAGDARLVLAEAVVFGRAAMGETVARGRLTDRWRVRRGGRLLFAETVRLDGAIADTLARPAAAAGGAALATVLVAPGDEATSEAVRALAGDFHGEVGVSAWNGIAVARFLAKDGAGLRHDLMRVLTALRGTALPRLWLN